MLCTSEKVHVLKNTVKNNFTDDAKLIFRLSIWDAASIEVLEVFTTKVLFVLDHFLW